MNYKSRAALMAALFILALNCFAENKTAKVETYKDIIEKAQNLVLQRDRNQALNILGNAIKKESSKSQSVNELKKTLNEISEVFLSDKAQQLNEVAMTLKRTDLNQAQQKTNEALRIEPDNQTLLLNSARLLIVKGDCATAQEQLKKIKLQNPYSDEVQLVYSQSLICENKYSETQKVIEQIDIKKSQWAKYWYVLTSELYYKEKNYLKAQEQVNQAIKIDNQYPEAQYWLWKIELIFKKKNRSAVEKYLMTCKNISAHIYRQYMIDPMLCRRTVEMESIGQE